MAAAESSACARATYCSWLTGLTKTCSDIDPHYLNETAVMPLSRTQFLAKVRSALHKAKAVDSPMTIINHLREPWLQLLKGQAEVRKLVQPKELIAKLGHLKTKSRRNGY